MEHRRQKAREGQFFWLFYLFYRDESFGQIQEKFFKRQTTMNSKKYNATFILDTRGYEEPVETLIEKLKGVVESVGGKVESAENLGQKNFARVPNRKFPSGIFVSIKFEGDASSPAQITEKLRLDKTVNRLMIQNA